jgi:hypothetical protein
MAYPATPITFSVKAPGDTIQPAHVNDLQTEITALEGALLSTGLAHNLNPNADSTRYLGSSALRWIIHGSQITPGSLPSTSLTSGALSTNLTIDGAQILAGSIPSTVLSTVGSATTNAVLTGEGWKPSTSLSGLGSPLSILLSTTINSSGGAATSVMASVAISGLTKNDSLEVYYSLWGSSQALGAPPIITAEGSTLMILGSNNTATPDVGQVVLQWGAMSDSCVFATGPGLTGVANTMTNAWTGSWTLRLTQGQAVSSGAITGRLTVYKRQG